jgi:hypothetical protein
MLTLGIVAVICLTVFAGPVEAACFKWCGCAGQTEHYGTRADEECDDVCAWQECYSFETDCEKWTQPTYEDLCDFPPACATQGVCSIS